MTFLCRSILLLALLPLASCIPLFQCTTPSTDVKLRMSIDVALIAVAANAPGNGFAEFHNSGGVNAFGRCTGTHDGRSCADCLANAVITLRNNCANDKDAVVWYPSCLLHYSTKNFFGNWKVRPMYLLLPSSEDAQSPSFSHDVLQSAVTVTNMAVQSGATLFAYTKLSFDELNGVTIYIMAQCTQDLSASQCQECLDWLRGSIPAECGNKDGCRLLHTSCIMRYGTSDFFV